MSDIDEFLDNPTLPPSGDPTPPPQAPGLVEPQPPVQPSAPVQFEDMQPVQPDTEPQKLTRDQVDEEYVSLLNVDINELDALTGDYHKLDGLTSDSGKAWLEAYFQGIKHLFKGNSFTESVERAASAWHQKVGIDGQQLGAGRPRFGSTTGNVISGERALMKVSSVLGLGAVVQIPLWHTGIWVSIKAPSEAALLELERRIGTEKVSLGRYTGGLVFSNTSVYTVSYVVNFALNHVYDASVKNITADALKEIIKVTDIPTLVWGLACAIYPNGYKYVRPCTANPSECQHLVTGLLQLSKLCWVDNSALSDWQKRHMTRRMEKFSPEDLKRYNEELGRGHSVTVAISDVLKVELKVPTILEYEHSGFNWVDGIVRLLEGSLGVSLKGNDRDEYISHQGQLTSLRQYSHWVNEITVGEDIVEDQETIELLLGTLSSEETISKNFFEQMAKYIDASTLSVIAVPKYHCPRCGGEQEADTQKDFHKLLLPIDVVRIFFTLLDQRIYKALSKNTL